MGAVLVTLIVLLMAIGFIVPRLLGRNVTEAKTISIETGIQNGTLGITIAALIVGGAGGLSTYALPSAVYSILMYLVCLPIVLWFRRLN